MHILFHFCCNALITSNKWRGFLLRWTDTVYCFREFLCYIINVVIQTATEKTSGFCYDNQAYCLCRRWMNRESSSKRVLRWDLFIWSQLPVYSIANMFVYSNQISSSNCLWIDARFIENETFCRIHTVFTFHWNTSGEYPMT